LAQASYTAQKFLPCLDLMGSGNILLEKRENLCGDRFPMLARPTAKGLIKLVGTFSTYSVAIVTPVL